MIVVSVKFKGRGKAYFFDPNGLEVAEGNRVVVETSKGLELADCVKGNHEVTDERIVPPLRPVVRIATRDDLRIAELCKERERDAFQIAEQKIAEHGLDMKLVDVECNFEGNKILFFFTSDGRVDFRELVKDLAGVFRTRIELRQIGVRDEAKMLGGIGICGRPFCCHQFLDDFEPVSTKMAKTQSLSLNPTKISGSCGRLMCCLRYEQEAYEDLVKSVPKNGCFVETTAGYGCVAQVNLLRQKVKVKLDGDESNLRTFDADEVAAVPGGRPKPGEPLPHVLKAVPKKAEEPEEKEDEWAMPPVFAEDTAAVREKKPAESTEKPEHSGSRRHRSRGGKKPESAGTGEQKPAAESRKQEKNRPEKPKQERQEKPAPQGGESGGENREKKSGSSHHRHHRKPSGGQGQPQRQGDGQPKQDRAGGEGGKRPENRSGENRGQSGPKPQKTEQPNGGGEKREGGGNHRRHHRSHAKPNGGEGKAE